MSGLRDRLKRLESRRGKAILRTIEGPESRIKDLIQAWRAVHPGAKVSVRVVTWPDEGEA